MRPAVTRFCMLIALLLLSMAALAQPIGHTVKFTRIGLHEGLSQSSVFSICQDYLGLIWVGTRDGVNRYDARRISTKRIPPSDRSRVSDNYFLSLLDDSKKRLWVGTSVGINLYDRYADHFIRFLLVYSQSGNVFSEPNVSA